MQYIHNRVTRYLQKKAHMVCKRGVIGLLDELQRQEVAGSDALGRVALQANFDEVVERRRRLRNAFHRALVRVPVEGR